MCCSLYHRVGIQMSYRKFVLIVFAEALVIFPFMYWFFHLPFIRK